MRDDGFGVVSQLDAVRAVPGDLLRDLLAPWSVECAELELDLSALGDEDLAPGLARLVAGGRSALPRGLVDALDRIEDLADEPGFDTLIRRLEATTGTTDWPARGLSPLSLAARAWVEHREAFEEAEIKRRSDRSGFVHEYMVAANDEPRVPSADELAALEERLGAYWQRRGRGGFCRMKAFREEQRLYLPIHRGDPWRTEPAVEGDSEAAVTYRPRTADLAAYDLRSGRLILKARDRSARNEYLAQIGEALFGDAAAVDRRPTVTLRPLVELGREALLPTPGLRDVELVALRVALNGRHRVVLSVTCADVLGALDGLGLDELDRGELLYAKLLLRFQQGRRRKLELGPPHQVAFDRRKNEHIVLRFLEERGFLLGAETAPAAPSPTTPQLGLWG